MKNIILKFIAVIIVLFVAQTKVNAQTTEQVSYYYKGKKVFYPVSYDRIIAEMKPGYSFAEMKKSVSKAISLTEDSIAGAEDTKQILINLKERSNEKAKTAVSTLNKLPGLLYARPICTGDGGKYWSYGKEFIVQLKPGTTFSNLQMLMDKDACTLVKKYPFNEGMYILAAGENAGYDGLAMANRFFETGLFEYAEPDSKSYTIIQSGTSENSKVIDQQPTSDQRLNTTTTLPNSYPVNDPLYQYQWAHNNTGSNYSEPDDGVGLIIGGTAGADMKIPKAWGITMGDPGIIIGVLDCGVDLNHPDLMNNLLPGFNAFTGNSGPGEGGNSSTSPKDAHGTACAGVIAALAQNSKGIAGIAPNCKIIPVKVFDASGAASISGFAAAIDYVTLQGASIISNSWSLGDVSSSVDAAINRAVTLGRNEKGCIVLFSSGNDNDPSLVYPANNAQVISVGGVNMCNERKMPGSVSCDREKWRSPHRNDDFGGSNYGFGLDVVAPCSRIATTDLQGAGGTNSDPSNDGDYTRNFNGTSAACPNAAGVAALLLSYDNSLSVDKATKILKYTADRVGNYIYAPGPDPVDFNGPWNFEMGYGRINAFRAIQFASFKVTNPNGGEFLSSGTSQIIEWDPGFTNDPPSLLNVKISLSTDGGLTFPIILENSTTNDGIASVMIPAINSKTARIKIEAIGEVFYDVSNENFSIGKPTIWFKSDDPLLQAGTINSNTAGLDTMMLDLYPAETGIDTTVKAWFSDGAFEVGGNKYKLNNATGNPTLNPPLNRERDGKFILGFGGLSGGQVLTGNDNEMPFVPGKPKTFMIVGSIACNASAQSSPLITVEDDGSGSTHTKTKISLGITKEGNKTFAYTGSSETTADGVAGVSVKDTFFIPDINVEYGKLRYLAIYEIDENGNNVKFRLNKADFPNFNPLNGLTYDLASDIHKFKIEKGRGFISEVIGFDGKLNAQDREQWEDYLYLKYNIKPSRLPIPSIPVIEVIGGTTVGNNTEICYGDSVQINISGELNGARDWVIRKDFCGKDYIGYGDGQAFGAGAAGFGYTGTIKPITTTTYFVRGEGKCNLTGPCASFTITVKTSPDPIPIIHATDSSICDGLPDTLYISNQHSIGAKWKWYKNSCCNGANLVGEGDSLFITGAPPNIYFARSEGPDCLIGPAYGFNVGEAQPQYYLMDSDGDGWGAGTPVSYCPSEVPAGWVLADAQSIDCDDHDNNVQTDCDLTTLFANATVSYGCPGKATILASAGYTNPLENPTPVYNYSFQKQGAGATWIVVSHSTLNYCTINLPPTTLNYRVVVTDNNGNIATKIFAVNPGTTPPPPNFTLQVSGCSNQGILLSPSSDNLLPPYSYFYQDADLWIQFANGGTEPVSFSPTNSQVLSYDIRAVNACGQVSVTHFNFGPRINYFNIVNKPTTCNDGILEVTSTSGGVLPYQYALEYYSTKDTGDGTVPIVSNYTKTKSSYQTSPRFENLPPNWYRLWVKDACGRENATDQWHIGGGYPELHYYIYGTQIATDSCNSLVTLRPTHHSPIALDYFGLNYFYPDPSTGAQPFEYGVQLHPGENMRWQSSPDFILPSGSYYFAMRDACGRVSNWERRGINIPLTSIINTIVEDDTCGKKITLNIYNFIGIEPNVSPLLYGISKNGSMLPNDVILQQSPVFRNVHEGIWMPFIKDGCGNIRSHTNINISTTPTVVISVNPFLNISAGQVATFTATVTNGGIEINYQWLKDGIEIPGANSAVYIDEHPTASSYSCNVTCFANCGGGAEVISSSNSLTLSVYQDLTAPCTPYVGPYNYNNSCISYVQLGAINHYSSCDEGHYSYISSSVANLVAGSAQSIKLRSGNYWNSIHCSVFIDFNRDGDFDDANERVVDNRDIDYDNISSFPFTVPVNASTGHCMMRVITESSDPCVNYSGEIEDYVINIQPAGSFCIPVVEFICGNGDNYIKNVTIGDISNITECDNGYGDFSALQSIETIEGGSLNYTIESGSQYNGGKVSIYIDYNHDGTFSDAEKVVDNEQLYGNSPLMGSFIVQAGLAIGDYRLRVVLESGYQALTDPCNIVWGEIEDYTLTIKPFLYCHTIDYPCGYHTINNFSIGNMANSSICSPTGNGYSNFSNQFTVNANAGETLNFSLITGPGYSTGVANIFIDYNNDGDFNDADERVVNAIYLYGSIYQTNSLGYSNGSFTLSTSIAPGSYRLRVITAQYEGIDTIDACQTAAGEIEDYTINIVAASNLYCIPAPTSGCAVSTITNVTLQSINNNSTCNTGATPDYSDFSASQRTNIVPGQTANFSVTCGGYYGYNYVKIYVDYDEDGNFNDNEENVAGGYVYGTTPFTSYFDIPVTLLPGNYRMRVVSDIGYNNYGLTACYSSNGETEDYTLVVPNCPPAQNIIVSSNSNSIHSGEVPLLLNNTDFGNVEPLNTVSKIYYITNNGIAPLRIFSYGFSGPNLSDFIVTNPPASMLIPGATTSITVKFTSDESFIAYPWTNPVSQATLHINTDDCDEPNFSFGIKATRICKISGPELEVLNNNNSIISGTNLNFVDPLNSTIFGDVPIGSTVTKLYVIKNTGLAALDLNGIYLYDYNGNQNQFHFTPPTNNPISLSPGDSITVPVHFSPNTLGVSRSSFFINSDDCDEPFYQFIVIGNGISGANCTPTTSTTTIQSCESYSWNGNTYTTSGTFTYLTANAAGCDSTATLNLTVNQPTASSTNISVCTNSLPYTWNETIYSAAGSYTIHLINAAGCDSAATLHLSIKDITVDSITGPKTVCEYASTSYLTTSTNVATYSVNALNATGYIWTVPALAKIRSGQGTNTITVAYATTFATGNISVTISNSCTAPVIKTLSVTSTKPLLGSISGPINACTFIGTETPVTYSIVPLGRPVTYNWVFPSNVTVVSGGTSTSTSVTLTFNSNFASSGGIPTTDAQRTLHVKAVAACGTSADKAFKISVTLPPASASLTGPANACPYMTTEAATYTAKKVANATSYLWTVPTGATILDHPGGAGTPNDTVITVHFDAVNFAGTGADKISVAGVSACGTGLAKTLVVKRGTLANAGVFLANPLNTDPTKPITDVCVQLMNGFDNSTGTPIEYKIRKVNGATSYIWNVTNTVGNAGIVSVTHPAGPGLNDTVITVLFDTSLPKTNTAISVKAANPCFPSGNTAKVLQVKPVVSATPGTISGPTDACTSIAQGTAYTYSIKKVPLATSYKWQIVGASASQAVITGHPGGAGTANDTVINVQFNTGYFSGGIAVQSERNCGRSVAKTLAVTVKKIPAPASLTGNTAPCPLASETYTCSRVSNANGYLWTVPLNATFINLADTAIEVTYPATALFKTGKVSVTATSVCSGNGAKSISIIKGTVCRPVFSKQSARSAKAVNVDKEETDFSLDIFPNPSSGNFTITINSSDILNNTQVNIVNEYGQEVYKKLLPNNLKQIHVTNIFSKGVYFVSCIQGTKKISKRIIILR